jgi:hypothetical protein
MQAIILSQNIFSMTKNKALCLKLGHASQISAVAAQKEARPI